MPEQKLVLRDAAVRISEDLWSKAHQALGDEDRETLKQHGSQLFEQNAIMIKEDLREKEKKQWTVMLAKKPFKLREIGLKIVGFIDASKGYIAKVVALEPHAALAWQGVALLLPVSFLTCGTVSRS